MHLLNESLSQIYLDKEAISEFKQSYLKNRPAILIGLYLYFGRILMLTSMRKAMV